MIPLVVTYRPEEVNDVLDDVEQARIKLTKTVKRLHESYAAPLSVEGISSDTDVVTDDPDIAIRLNYCYQKLKEIVEGLDHCQDSIEQLKRAVPW